MARPRKDLAPQKVKEARAMLRRGRPDAEVAAAMGMSLRTFVRRKSELLSAVKAERGASMKARPHRAPVAAISADQAKALATQVPDADERMPLDVVSHWIPRVEQALEVVEGEGDLKTFALLIAKLDSLVARKERLSPDVQPDPNDDPDLMKEAAATRARLQKMLQQLGGAT